MRQQLESALLQHQVLFFREQPIEPQQQAAFAAQFGDLHIHPLYPNVPEQPEILVLDTEVTDVRDNAIWHTDVSFLQTPALGAVLAVKHLPARGGDTLWASSSAAYDALSQPLQQLLDGLTATHDFTRSFLWSVSATPPRRWRTTTKCNAPTRPWFTQWCARIPSPGARVC